MQNTTQLKDTLELWDQFAKTADFKSNVYDKQLLEVIKQELGFNTSSDVRSELGIHKTTSEQLLSILLKLMKPFSVMLNDLLAMFEEAGAQSSDDNIQIEFNFEDAKNNFGLDLENFRMYKETVEKVVCYEWHLENREPWIDFCEPILNILGRKDYSYINKLSLPNEISDWLKRYRDRERNWPDDFPMPPQSGDEIIDHLMAEIWELPRTACELYKKGYQSDLRRYGSLTKQAGPAHLNFYYAETDFWIGTFVKMLYALAFHVKVLKRDKVEEIKERLEKYRNSLPIVCVEKEKRIKNLLDILNLPVWKKRYALYSAWVSTQIVSAFDKSAVRYNVINGALSFSFGGSKIAFIRNFPFDIVLLAELRTPYASVIGHGRLNNIQPDYSLCIKDETDPKNTIIVVECKQYKSPSKKNFTEAIIDYAGGRPNAKVILANYTSVPETFRLGLPSDVSDRVPFFDALLPGSISCDSFKKAIRESISQKCQVCLSWQKAPLDLDLILIMKDVNGAITKVNFSSMGSLDHFPYAQLDKDTRNRFGCETITAIVSETTIYEFYVHNYSGEKTDGEIIIDIWYNNNNLLSAKSNADLDRNSLWHVVTIESSKIHKVDKIVPY